jgi:hypothetical protein
VNKKWLVIALFVSVAGCKQGSGERCQSNEDCSSGVCATSAPKVCVAEGGSNDPIDADLPIDAAIDAAAVAPAQSGR